MAKEIWYFYLEEPNAIKYVKESRSKDNGIRTAGKASTKTKEAFILGIKVTGIKLMRKIVEQSVLLYSTERPHWSCHMKTPKFMHKQSAIKSKSNQRKRAEENIPLLVI